MTPDRPRLRFSPAPTGSLHVGSARSALFNWLAARHLGGTLVLRIEDTDRERSTDEHIANIVRSFEWLGIDFDEGPYRQSERTHLYLDALDKLVAGGHTYRCACTPDEVQARNQVTKKPGYDGHCRDRGHDAGVLRFRTPDEGETSFDDLIRGTVTFANANLEDFVLARADGSTLFLLANAVDDLDMGITHVVRGDDLINVTPKVLLIRQALGHPEVPVFAHLPMIVNEQRKKLSKRRDDVALESYRDRGFLPEAMVNFLALLGWGPPDGVEIRPLREIVDLFSLTDVGKAGAFFDVKKLTHVNKTYIADLPPAELVERSRPWLDAAFGTWDESLVLATAAEAATRLATLDEYPENVAFLFASGDVLAADQPDFAKLVAGDPAKVAGILDAALAGFGDCDWTQDALRDVVVAAGAAVGEERLGKAQEPVRLAVSGRRIGLPLWLMLELLGRDEVIDRVRTARALMT